MPVTDKTERVLPVITEDELRKSIEDLETKPLEAATPPAQPIIEVTKLEKTVADKLKEAPEPLRKALDVSQTLSDFASVIGLHVDASLGVMQKSLQASADRDLAFLRVVSDLKKSVDSLKEEVAKQGALPGTPAAAAPVTVGSDGILKKAVGGSDKTVDPTVLRKSILTGLERMAKTADAGSVDQSRAISAVAKFESTGQISDEMLKQALSAK